MVTKKVKPPEWNKIGIKLKKENHESLITLINALYDRSENNRNFIKTHVFGSQVTTEAYKRIITNAIYIDTNDRDNKVEFGIAKNAITDFKDAKGDPEDVLDLMIHYVEVGTEQTHGICIDYGSYYTSLESMFNRIIKRLTGKDKEHAEFFRPRLEAIIKNSDHGGYGYGSTIQEMFDKAF